MDSDRLVNVGKATGLVVAGKIASDFISEKVGNQYVGGAIVAGIGLFGVKGHDGTYLAAGALADIAEALIKQFVKI